MKTASNDAVECSTDQGGGRRRGRALGTAANNERKIIGSSHPQRLDHREFAAVDAVKDIGCALSCYVDVDLHLDVVQVRIMPSLSMPLGHCTALGDFNAGDFWQLGSGLDDARSIFD